MASFLRRISSCRSFHATAVLRQGRRRTVDEIENEAVKERIRNWLDLVEQAKEPNDKLKKVTAAEKRKGSELGQTHRPRTLNPLRKIVNKFKSKHVKAVEAAAKKINDEVADARKIAEETVEEEGEDINLDDFLE